MALTHNKRQRYVTIERDVALRSGLALFHLIGKMRHEELATSLVRTMPRIVAFRSHHEPPFIARVYRPERKNTHSESPGRVVMDLSRDDWLKALQRRPS